MTFTTYDTKKFTEEKNQQKKRGRYWFGIGPPTYEPSTSTAMKWARGDSPVFISERVRGWRGGGNPDQTNRYGPMGFQELIDGRRIGRLVDDLVYITWCVCRCLGSSISEEVPHLHSSLFGFGAVVLLFLLFYGSSLVRPPPGSGSHMIVTTLDDDL